jgi:hypothetical protein
MVELIQISSLNEAQEILSKIDSDMLILLDVDDTLITPKSAMFRMDGQPDFIDQLKKRAAEIPNFIEILSTWRQQRQSILVEEGWPQMIADWQEMGATVYGFTQVTTGSFGIIKSMEEWRLTELHSHGIFFTPQAGGYDAFKILEGTHGYACFYKGIMMTGPFTKRQMLENFMIALALQPKRIIFFDDRLEQVEAIAAFAKEHKIDFTGIHYQGALEIKGEGSQEIMVYQQKCLVEELRWLEDEEAAQELQAF